MNPLSILIVEDNAVIGSLLAETLADMGHKVAGIESTEEGAVAAVERNKPDLMLVDLILSEGNGVAAIKRITLGTPIPHVFMSGRGSLAVPPGALVLSKPFRLVDLVRAIGRALGEAGPPA